MFINSVDVDIGGITPYTIRIVIYLNIGRPPMDGVYPFILLTTLASSLTRKANTTKAKSKSQ